MTLTDVVYWAKTPDQPAPCAEELQPIKTEGWVSSFSKPRIGGLWTSPVETEYSWEDWCRENQMDWLHDRYVLHVSGTPRILVVDSAADLEQVWHSYGRRRDWSGHLDRDLNYTLMAEDYDAFWLTARGHFDTRMAMDLNTYAWDCDTVLWFRWCFSSVTKTSVRTSA